MLSSAVIRSPQPPSADRARRLVRAIASFPLGHPQFSSIRSLPCRRPQAQPTAMVLALFAGTQPWLVRDAVSPFFSHYSKLFCASQKYISLRSNHFHTLCAKHPGWGFSSDSSPRAPVCIFLHFSARPKTPTLSSSITSTGLHKNTPGVAHVGFFLYLLTPSTSFTSAPTATGGVCYGVHP